MNPVLRRKLSILVRLSKADGEFAVSEKNLIKDIGLRNGLKQEEINELISNPEQIGSLGALMYDKVVDYLTDCLLIMCVDGKVLKSEIMFCEDIAFRLGYKKSVIDKLMASISSDKMMNREQVYRLISSLPHPSK